MTSHTIAGGSRYDAASRPKRATDKTQKTKVEAVGATVRLNTGLGMMAAIAPTTVTAELVRLLLPGGAARRHANVAAGLRGQ